MTTISQRIRSAADALDIRYVLAVMDPAAVGEVEFRHDIGDPLTAYLGRLANDARTIERAGFEDDDVAEAMSPELVALIEAIEAAVDRG